jgi:hypothetical protein
LAPDTGIETQLLWPFVVLRVDALTLVHAALIGPLILADLELVVGSIFAPSSNGA